MPTLVRARPTACARPTPPKSRAWRAQGGVADGSTSRSEMDRIAGMRGFEKKQTSMLVLRSPEDFVPKRHPIRQMKKIADDVLRSLSTTLEAMYAAGGRPSIPPERLLKATVLMAL